MVLVRKRCCERIVEHCGCFTEIDAVLFEIGLVLPDIPGENHAASINVMRCRPGVSSGADGSMLTAECFFWPTANCQLLIAAFDQR